MRGSASAHNTVSMTLWLFFAMVLILRQGETLLLGYI